MGTYKIPPGKRDFQHMKIPSCQTQIMWQDRCCFSLTRAVATVCLFAHAFVKIPPHELRMRCVETWSICKSHSGRHLRITTCLFVIEIRCAFASPMLLSAFVTSLCALLIAVRIVAFTCCTRWLQFLCGTAAPRPWRFEIKVVAHMVRMPTDKCKTAIVLVK